VAAVSWAAILVRLCDAPSLGIAFYRMFFATLAILPWGLRSTGSVSARTYGLAITAGVLLGLHFATWISSLAFTTVASSVVLVSAQPVFTAILGPLFLGERPGGRGWAAVALALAGTVVLAGGDWRGDPRALFGDALALAGALTASLYLMIGRRVRERIGFTRYLTVIYGTAAASLLVMAAAGGVSLRGYPGWTWLWLVLLAAGPNLLGHSLLNWSVRRLRALTVNLAILGEPLLATLYAALLLAEVPTPSFYVGAALIVAGVALAVWEESGRPQAPTTPPP
jgi:drug/metabolite transporter (DMT)-like permease